MRLRDTLVLVGAKLRVRKLRTFVTVATASALFGVVIAVIVVVKGFFNGMDGVANNAQGSEVIMSMHYASDELRVAEVQAEAMRLYKESTDPLKQNPMVVLEAAEDGYAPPPYLDSNNPFAVAAMEWYRPELNKKVKDAMVKTIKPGGGKVMAAMDSYCAKTMYIKELTLSYEAENAGCFNNVGGRSVIVVDSDVLGKFTKISEVRNDAIQILMPLDQAADMMGISAPNTFSDHAAAQLQKYIREVNERAIGHEFVGTYWDGDEKEVSFEIVGILPAYKNVTTVDDATINPLEVVLRSIQKDSYLPFAVTNPEAAAFRKVYKLEVGAFESMIIVSFSNAETADAFEPDRSLQIGGSEFIGNKLSIMRTHDAFDRSMIAFVVIFSVISVIIMAGTVSRVIDDERSSIALYRAVGAGMRDVLKVYAGYILAMSLLVVLCATVIGVGLAGVITLANTAQITANVGAMYNVADLETMVFIGFDVRILLVYAAIVAIGLVCLLLVLDKIMSRDIIKNLRK